MNPPFGDVPHLTILANLNFARDIRGALASGAEGIGLYRTEFEFMVAGKLLTENEQFELYHKIVTSLEGRCAHIRLLDIQADKTHPSFVRGRNKKAGCKSYGAQFLIDNPRILKTQVSAIARASISGPVCIIYPFIADLEQFLEVKAAVVRSLEGLKCGSLKHGLMFELPSACLQARPLFCEADLGCLGSNDLNKFLFGVDRSNPCQRPAYMKGHPVLRALVRKVALAAQLETRPLLFCGELANDPQNLDWLLECGIRTISVTPDSIPELRKRLTQLENSILEPDGQLAPSGK